MTTANVTVKTAVGDVEVRAEVAGTKVVLSQLDGGSWHWAGNGVLRQTADGVSIDDCSARFGLLDVDCIDEVYTALEAALSESAPDEIEIISVKPDSSEDGEGAAYWVTARVNGKRVRLSAAPHSDGRPGLGPCGDSLDDWCPVELRTAFGDDEANRLGREAILMARP